MVGLIGGPASWGLVTSRIDGEAAPDGGGRPIVLRGYGKVPAGMEIPPPRIDGFHHDLNAILANLARTPPSVDEGLRALAPLAETEVEARETMDFGSDDLSHAQADPRGIGAIRLRIADFNSVTGEEKAAAARKLLTPDRAWRLIIAAAHSALLGGRGNSAPCPMCCLSLRGH